MSGSCAWFSVNNTSNLIQNTISSPSWQSQFRISINSSFRYPTFQHRHTTVVNTRAQHQHCSLYFVLMKVTNRSALAIYGYGSYGSATCGCPQILKEWLVYHEVHVLNYIFALVYNMRGWICRLLHADKSGLIGQGKQHEPRPQKWRPAAKRYSPC